MTPTQSIPNIQGEGIVSAVDQILVVDSDEIICELINYNLQKDYRITVCATADDALDVDIASQSLIILDTNLKGTISGTDFITMLQRSSSTARVPFIICSSNDSEDAIIRGFDAGADDYIIKPFSLREMVARVKSVLRRHNIMSRLAGSTVTHHHPTTREYRVQELVMYPESMRVEVKCSPVSLTRTEFQILKLFLKEPGRFFSREDIHVKVWNDNERTGLRTVDVNISRLRKKLGPIYGPMLVSRPGQGYGIEVK